MRLRGSTQIITRDAEGSYKYGRDGMAEYLHYLAMEGGSDHAFGDVQSPTGAVDRFGKRVLRQDDQGFVWVERYKTQDEAMAEVERLEEIWFDWTNDAECIDCGTFFASEEGACWCCGARNAKERES